MDSYFIINGLLLFFLIVTAISIAVTRDLLFAIIMLGIFGLLMAMLYLVMGAADVAITEAAVGAGISTILLLCTIALTGREKPKRERKSNNIVPLLVVMVTGGALIYATLDLPGFGNPTAPIHQHVAPYYLENTQKEMGIPNVVTSVLASYRGYDTLGEVVVVFTAAMSVLLLIGDGINRKRRKKE